MKASENALILFVKTPRAGEVKSRLQPALGAQRACDLYRAVNEDLVAHLAGRDAFDLVVFFWPPGDRLTIEEWLGKGLIYHPQMGEDLGDRMHQAFVWGSQRGYRKMVLVGSDIPTLELSTVAAAFRGLRSNDLVLGPSTDGGYYLIGLTRPCSLLFTEMNWSTNRVCRETLDRVQAAGLAVHMLDLETDIDTWEDLAELWNRLEAQSFKKRYLHLGRTMRVLRPLFGKSAEGSHG